MVNRTNAINTSVGLLLVGIALLFWSQRNYTSQYGGVFSDPLIAILAILGLVLAGFGLTGRSPGGASTDVERVPLIGFIRAAVLLIAWVATLPALGYVIGSIVFFFLTALLMRKERPGLGGLALDATISVLVVVAFNSLFTQVLLVRLPQFSL